MGDKFENQQAAAYSRLVQQYPLSTHVDEAKSRLQAMNRPVPEPDPVAYSRMKYELENRGSRSLMGKVWGPFSSRPDMTAAAKSGSPQMEGFRPTIPASVPAVAAGTQGTSDVTAVMASTGDVNQLDQNPDARSAAAQSATPTAGAPAAAEGSAPAQPAQAAPAVQPITITRQGVDINTAAEAELAKLPGVGKNNARRIIAGRPFLSVQDLIRVGIPQKTINRLKPDAAAPNAKPAATAAATPATK